MTHAPRHLSRREIEAAYRVLSFADKVRLAKLADVLAEGQELSGDDLLQEALLKALDGERLCPRHVAFPTFLANAMRSLAWASRERAQIDPLAGAADVADHHGPGGLLEDARASPEERLAVKRDCKARQQALVDLFASDAEALAVLLALFDGRSAEEIQAALTIDATAYGTIRRRMRRKIDAAFKGGWRE